MVGEQDKGLGLGASPPSAPTALAPPSGVEPASGLEQSRSSTGAGFTPGPWLLAAKPSSVVGWPIVAPQAMGRVVCSLNYADPKAFAGRQPGDRKFNAESRANGHLIASAPDLYAATESAFCVLDADQYPSVVAKLRAALAKARGEQQP